MKAPRTTKIVLTGGPCAGKTTLTQVIARVYQDDVVIVPEAASLLFLGGFPRWPEEEARRATQRAIYHVQCQLENAFATRYPGKILILDRGTIDGAAYWPDGGRGFFADLETSLSRELARYDHVLYLESASEKDYAANLSKNPNRTESWEDAQSLDERNHAIWSRHPMLMLIRNERSFGRKISEVIEAIANIISAEAD